jgi:hypothetical protein
MKQINIVHVNFYKLENKANIRTDKCLSFKHDRRFKIHMMLSSSNIELIKVSNVFISSYQCSNRKHRKSGKSILFAISFNLDFIFEVYAIYVWSTILAILFFFLF